MPFVFKWNLLKYFSRWEEQCVTNMDLVFDAKVVYGVALLQILEAGI